MNNRKFIAEYAKALDCSTEEATELAEAVIEAFKENVLQGNPVNVRHFGTFEVKKMMERISVIPSTGERFLIPPKLVLSFKPAPFLKRKEK